jgi:predicted phosphodiesterase
MKLTVISDIHGLFNNLILKKGETLIIAGDFSIEGQEEEFKRFIKWLDKQKFKNKIVVGGNHDGYIYNNEKAKQKLKQYCIYLENEGTKLNNINFWGSPYTPRFNYWFFMKERGKELKENWDLVPNNTNVLIGHGMPYGILDNTSYPNGDIGQNVGDFDLLNKIKHLSNLKIYIGGHLHLNGGKIYIKNNIQFINASVVNEDYELTNKPIIIEI